MQPHYVQSQKRSLGCTPLSAVFLPHSGSPRSRLRECSLTMYKAKRGLWAAHPYPLSFCRILVLLGLVCVNAASLCTKPKEVFGLHTLIRCLSAAFWFSSVSFA